jgi:uncharacterized metal-binding protein YceD (DUF177 family)
MAVTAPRFSLPAVDLEHGDKELEEDIPVDWLRATFEATEATPGDQPGRLEVTLSKSGKDVMVRGSARASVTLPCARTLDPVAYDLRAEIFLMLSPGKVAVRTKPRKHAEKPADKVAAGKAPAPQKAKKKKREEEPELSDDDAAQDTYDGDTVVLDDFIREFLVLELPMFPLREDLRAEATPAIERDPEPAVNGPDKGEVLDPRLAPLAAIASRLRQKKE